MSPAQTSKGYGSIDNDYFPYGWYGYGYDDYGRRYFHQVNHNFISSNHYGNIEHIMNIGGAMRGGGRR
ncbi:hypothetical protein [Francisella sp. 19X1-34]|uniref:hypothetical protein n=1 Tax=Francisella sp. 19X1-34 TaxID=3087177 RepID=UPI002E30D100|nr:hypothetical protein [Francisella sp. 19X1-34]MED7788383.1 hypothetical protein [Francisella sp. 19X1-34]